MLDQLMILVRSNLIEIYGNKEANIELRKTEHLPDGVSVSGQIVSQTQKFRVRWY